jgi:hypothetical protein
MSFEEAKAAAVANLTADATLEELREAARDLRALAPDSALAELVEAKIDRLVASRSASADSAQRRFIGRDCDTNIGGIERAAVRERMNGAHAARPLLQAGARVSLSHQSL